ncbi:pantetheine-phosphate adenylyltransferase [Helicobacter sp. MIT 99-5507]|uniref:pantetheine-phosphate adenylyltransferase n=1 Tax=Helicobacter sp. MIT 99-5507 TaxID=152489 RepID=UPI000E1E7BC4|nr:pantetheine-phosphate adenylyltransferase [Helicobacter sp. MIT 99-5507]RDU57489.1 pantetheine-phosphate adenylyltransferase [Helicobacter sp. MIT 99-5507]
MSKIAIYPGTFDPVTNGHLDIVRRSCEIFEKVIVAVAESSTKNPMFSLECRVEMLKLATKKIDNVTIEPFSCLLADFAKQKESNILVRGLRAVGDFEYELQIGYANSSLNSDLGTVYFMPTLKNIFISSSIVRSILVYSYNVEHLVPKEVYTYIKSNFRINGD